MEFQDYIKEKKELYDHFLYFIEEENENENNFSKLIQNIQKHNYQENPEEFKSILHLINKVSSNHHRTTMFLQKIQKIIFHYKEYITKSFKNNELFDIFKKNPLILYFLVEQNIITLDNSITSSIFNEYREFVYRQHESHEKVDTSSKYKNFIEKNSIIEKYKFYFFNHIQFDPEERSEVLKDLLKIDEKILEDFDQKCQTGENDCYITKLIRDDSVEEFIVYTNKFNISLSSEIKESIFETHPFLLRKRATLIEYAAFFSSMKIFNYLQMNGVELAPSLWLYAINGNNSEVIQILEENHINPKDDTYIECLKESIKCHHNSIAQYLEENYQDKMEVMNKKNFTNNQISFGFHYYNYDFIQNSPKCKYSQGLNYLLFYACKYDHLPIVKFLVNEKEVDVNQTIIFNIIFF